MQSDWSKQEVRLIVEDYFNMLRSEMSGSAYNKTTHRLSLLPKLQNRSTGSVEYKHQNISAALIKMGLPFIKGYKPRFNYQFIIEKEINNFIAANKNYLEKEFDAFSTSTAIAKNLNEIDFSSILYDNPIINSVSENEPSFRPIKINYLEKEQNNRFLGEAGEQLVIMYERWRLQNSRKESLADKIEWVSKEKGDGAGFDILSKNTNGTDRFIEVKTTKLSKETPIYLSRTEYKFALLKEKDFFLYRLFDFSASPQMFIRNGKYESFCNIQPEVYKGYF